MNTEHAPHIEILCADRSPCNESAGREMAGCLAIDGVVQCYFPTTSAMRRNASLYAAAPDYDLAARRLVAEFDQIPKALVDQLSNEFCNSMSLLVEAIAKAKGDAL